ncbi:MAG: helix-turn-helix transcriptional regulator [Candidatus Aenigmarchaeota archaeon]|nr:helix-turn-helix transcriptional regulator [Candidatus Aenigmarchaeota archaeon]
MLIQYGFGPKIRELREGRGLKPEDVAGKLHLDAYLQIEDSGYIPTLEEAQSILRRLGVHQDTPEYLTLLRARTADKETEVHDPKRRYNVTVPRATGIADDGTPVIGQVPVFLAGSHEHSGNPSKKTVEL